MSFKTYPLLCLCCLSIVVLFSIIRSSSFESRKIAAQKAWAEDIYDVCVVGAGLAGAVVAEQYSQRLGKQVLVLEKQSHVGGKYADAVDRETGLRVPLHGFHHFHTSDKRVWDYVNRFGEWERYEHRVLAFLEGKHVPIPVNIDTVNMLFDLEIGSPERMNDWLNEEQRVGTPRTIAEEFANWMGQRLYRKLFRPNFEKQWVELDALLPDSLAMLPVRTDWDWRFSTDQFQALPSNGYDALFWKMFDNSLVTIRLNTNYFDWKETLTCGKTYYTGRIDDYFHNVNLPKLEYRSLEFEREVIRNVDCIQPVAVVEHLSKEVNYTRVTEPKHIGNQSSPHTLIFYERFGNGTGASQLVPTPQNMHLYNEYKELAKMEENFIFLEKLPGIGETIQDALRCTSYEINL